MNSRSWTIAIYFWFEYSPSAPTPDAKLLGRVRFTDLLLISNPRIPRYPAVMYICMIRSCAVVDDCGRVPTRPLSGTTDVTVLYGEGAFFARL